MFVPLEDFVISSMHVGKRQNKHECQDVMGWPDIQIELPCCAPPVFTVM